MDEHGPDTGDGSDTGHGHGHGHEAKTSDEAAELLADVAAVLFDMDGTIVDSDAAVDRSWAAWAAEHDVHPDVLHAPPGQPALTTVRQLRPDLSDDAAQTAALRQMELQYDDLDDVGALPGAHAVVDVLTRLGLPWAVVTSADRVLAENRLAAAGLTAPVLVTVEDTLRGKPHPDGFLAAAAALGVDPARCLVVEDAAVGVAAGHAAGMTVAGLKGSGGDIPLAHLHELVALLLVSH